MSEKVSQLSEEKKEALEIKAWFNCLDVNGEGKVSVKSIVMGNKGIGFTPTDKEAIDIIRELDTNDTGYVIFEKYEAFLKEYLRKRCKTLAGT